MRSTETMLANRSRRTSKAWSVPGALLALSFVPLAAGAFRLAQLAGGAVATAWPSGIDQKRCELLHPSMPRSARSSSTSRYDRP